jgi:hypothetical protein
MNFSSLFYREKEIVKLNFWNLFLSYFGNFIFILSLLIILTKQNSNLNYIIIYFLTITQSQLFLYIFNKIDEKEKIFLYSILIFEQQLKFIVTRFSSIFLLNLIFLALINFGLQNFYQNTSKINHINILLISNFIIILNTTIIYSLIFFNKGKSLTNFALLFLIPCNLPAIIFFVNSNQNLIYLTLLTAFINLMISSFFNKIK